MQNLEVTKDWTKGKRKGSMFWWTRTFKNTKGCVSHEHVLAASPKEANEKANAVKQWKEKPNGNDKADRRIQHKRNKG